MKFSILVLSLALGLPASAKTWHKVRKSSRNPAAAGDYTRLLCQGTASDGDGVAFIITYDHSAKSGNQIQSVDFFKDDADYRKEGISTSNLVVGPGKYIGKLSDESREGMSPTAPYGGSFCDLKFDEKYDAKSGVRHVESKGEEQGGLPGEGRLSLDIAYSAGKFELRHIKAAYPISVKPNPNKPSRSGMPFKVITYDRSEALECNQPVSIEFEDLSSCSD